MFQTKSKPKEKQFTQSNGAFNVGDDQRQSKDVSDVCKIT